MRGKQILRWAVASAVGALMVLPLGPQRGEAGESGAGYKVLAPIRRGNLTIFPVVVARSHDTSTFLTLDEGLRSGEVVVGEAGSSAFQPLRRGRRLPAVDGAQVNSLMLVNNSKRPLILLAGEILTGGKQDRVVGKDRIVPAESDPIDLAVFCVEPHRWVATKNQFGPLSGQMAQPSVRRSAMADQNQGEVWAKVRASAAAMMGMASPQAARQIESSSSYADMVSNLEVKQRVNAVAAPLEQSYAEVLSQLHERNAVGVVAAVNDQIIWADLFASTALLQKYWPKLIRSYAAEALTRPAAAGRPDEQAAQTFLQDLGGRRETVESEPGVYRRREVEGEGFTAFQLTALLPGTGFDLHIAKMAD